MKLGIVVGHSKKSPGAKNIELGVVEYSLNLELAAAIHTECQRREIDSQLIYRLNGYSKLPTDINNTDVDFCISVHHNGADNTSIDGNETLYYHKSEKSKKFARYVNNEMYNCLQVRNRDVKPVNSEDRGGYVLKYTSMPCILIEPYFMTNKEAVLKRNSSKLASHIVDGYQAFLTA